MNRFERIFKKRLLIIAASILLVGLCAPCSWAKVYKITSLGDSITASRAGYASYRYYLWNLVDGNPIDFVGTNAGVSLGEPLYPYFDQAHEGHGGYTADDVLNQIDQWIQETNPDVVLCHLGTNDLWLGESVSSTINELGQIIDRIRVVNSNVIILLAQIIPIDFVPTETVQNFNTEISLLAAQKNTQNSPVVAVDQWTGFNTITDTFDGVHPNDQGEQKIAWNFYTELLQVLPAPGSISPEWSDYQVTVNMRSDDDDAIGVMFRVLDNHNYYRFSWDSSHLYRRLVKVVDGQFTLLDEDAVPYVPGQTYALKIVADGSILEVWIDGALIFSVVDDSIVEGSIAFYSYANSGAYFDDVLVENIATGAALFSGDLSGGMTTEWGTVDEASELGPSSWSTASGTLVQSSNIYSLPIDPADLPKLGTYALYDIPAQQDLDGDGISDQDEVSVYGTDPGLVDTDDDGMDDGEEIDYWGGPSEPTKWDDDDDFDEAINLLDSDSDNDGALDGYEVYWSTDPLDPVSTPAMIDWTDYRLTLNMRSDDNDAIGVMFRYQDNNNYYRFSWDRERRYRRLVKVENGQFTLLAEDDIPYGSGQTYRVKIFALGSTLEVWVNGWLILSAQDASLTDGTIAFYSWGNEGNYFDDVQVESLATGDVHLFEDFNDGQMTGWTVVDEGTGNPLAEWSTLTGTLVQSSNTYSLPIDPADLPKLGTYAFYEISTLPTFSITATAGAGGTISPSGAVAVNEGDDQSFTITPDSGFHVLDVLVDGTSQGATTSYTFTNVTAAHSIAATFEADTGTHLITATAGAGGTISPSGAVAVNEGDDQSFTITPDSGFHVLDVLVDGTSQGATTSYTFTNVTAAHSIAATFEADTGTHLITATAGAGGTISPSGAVAVNEGDDQSFTITPDSGFHVLDVLVDGTSQGATTSYTFTNVTAAHSIAATFEADTGTHLITATAGAGGTISPSGVVAVNEGDDQSFTITPDSGFHVLDVLVDGTSQGATTSYTFTNVTAAHSIAATFEADTGTYPITATAGAGGTISPSGVVAVNEGDDQSFTITPDSGFHVLDVLVDGTSQGATTSYTFTNVTAAHSIAVTFEANITIEWADYQVTVNMRSDDDDAIGVMFRVLDNHNYYRFSWDSSRLYRRLVKVVDGQFTLLDEDAVPYVPGQTYALKIVADGSILEVWIDGALIFSVVDDSIVEGSIAFYCWGNQGGNFDDVLVKSLDLNAVLLSESFDAGFMTYWNVVDEGTGGTPSDWSAASGTLVQSSNIYSLPIDPADLPKLGTYALYDIPAQQDLDGDGISDQDEVSVYGTDPGLVDTDDDGMDDGEEIDYWGGPSEPTKWDDDDDFDEAINLLDSDSDNDGALDGYEVYWSTDPLDPVSTPAMIDWTDYRLTLNMRSDDNDAIGVMFRYQDNNNYYRFSWDRERRYRRLVKVENGQFTLLAEDDIPYGSGQTYRVKIFALGSTLEVWVNGWLILSAQDASLTDGTIAFYSWGNEGNYFDDVQVESLATGDVHLFEDFNDGQMTGWTVVDEGTGNPLAEWSTLTGTLVQSSNTYSLPIDPADLPKLGTYAFYEN